MYASYIVRFIYFYLRVLGDKEQQIMRFQQQRNTAARLESSAELSSNKDSKDKAEGSKANNNSL